MTHIAVLLMAVLCWQEREVSSLGGWLVSVQSKFTGMDDPKTSTWKHGCSGTVVSVRSALTCASCVMYPDDRLGPQIVNPEELRLYGGNECPDSASTDADGQIVYVRNVEVHPEYFLNENDKIPNEFNFAILIAKKPFKIGNSLQVLPLYSTDVDDVREVLMTNKPACFTLTWHFYMNGRPVNDKPKWGEISVALENIRGCRNLSSRLVRLGTPMESSYSCAKGLKGLPICRVDTGSPIVCERKLLAIIINDRLDCDNDEEHVVISGINNALAFLTDPGLYRLPDKQPTEEPHTTIVERGRSSQAHILPVMAAIMLKMSVVVYSIKGIITAVF